MQSNVHGGHLSYYRAKAGQASTYTNFIEDINIREVLKNLPFEKMGLLATAAHASFCVTL